MYTPYVLGAYAAALLLLLVGLRVIEGSTPELRGVRFVNRYILCILGALVFFVLRLWIPAAMSMFGSNLLSFASAVFLYLGTAEIQQARPRLRGAMMGVCAAGIAAQLWLSAARQPIGSRLLVHCAVMTVIFGSAAQVLYRESDDVLRRPRQGAAALMTLAAMLQLFWGVLGVLYPPGPDVLHLGMLETALSYLAMVLACANVTALMWLSLCVHRRDLQRIAHTDGLTELLNRRAFEDILGRELPRCDRTGRNLGAMMIDIDHFKEINDTLGHRAGDDVLRHVAESLRESTRFSDVLARYGGEEFVVLIRDANESETELVAERIRHGIASLCGLPGGVRLTVSIGVAMSRVSEMPEDFLLRCDAALYCAKRGGRNSVVVHRSAGTEPIVAL